MTTTQKSQPKEASPKKSPRKKSPGPSDATTILRADHSLVNGLFAKYEAANTSAEKKKLVENICTELSVHAQIEEEIFYPAVKAALKDQVLVPEATVEHASLKALIAEVEGMEPDGKCSMQRSRFSANTSNIT